MKTAEWVAIAGVVLVFVFWLAFWGTLVYAAAHFISKYW